MTSSSQLLGLLIIAVTKLGGSRSATICSQTAATLLDSSTCFEENHNYQFIIQHAGLHLSQRAEVAILLIQRDCG